MNLLNNITEYLLIKKDRIVILKDFNEIILYLDCYDPLDSVNKIKR